MAKKRKYKNGGNVDDIFEYTTYLVTAETDNDSNPIYTGDDFESAKLEFDSANISEFSNDYGGMVLLRKLTNKYKFVGDLEDGYYEMSDFPIEDYYNDSDYYELIEEGDYEHIDSKDVKDDSKEIEKQKANDLRDSIENYVSKISKKNKTAGFLGMTYYSLIPYLDGYIKVRVSDHFFNIQNIRLGKNVLEFLDETNYKRNEYENIYGFLSIHIIDSDSDYYRDKNNFKKDYKYDKENSEYPDLIKYLTYDVSKDEVDEIDYEYDIDNELDDIKSEIDKGMESGIFNEDDEVSYEKGGTIENNFEYTIGGL